MSARWSSRPADHGPLRRREGGRRLLQQQPLSRGDAPRRHDPLRARLRGRRAALLGALALAPRRCGRAGAHHLPALCGDALSGGRALPLRAHPGGARGQGGHRAHRPAEDPRAQRLVRRLPRASGRLPHRRAQAEGAGGTVRDRDRPRLRRGLDGLWRAPGEGGDPGAPRRHLALHLHPRPDPRRRGGRNPHHRRRHRRARGGLRHRRPPRQPRLRAGRGEPVGGLRGGLVPHRRLLQSRPDDPAQRGQREPRPRPAAGRLRGRAAHLPGRHLGGHHQRQRPPHQRRAVLLRADRRAPWAGGGRRQLLRRPRRGLRDRRPRRRRWPT